MNKFKAFFTFLAFIWLLSCGFLAIYGFAQGSSDANRWAWVGLLINAWSLPFWMILRYLFSKSFTGDLREPVAFTGVLLGLATVLLTDTERGLPIYLAITNLFVLLVYLYHLSTVVPPKMPSVDSVFPQLGFNDPCGSSETRVGHWQADKYCRENQLSGVLLVFLRGSYCADSRNQLHHLRVLLPEMRRRNIGLMLWSVQSEDKWPQHLVGTVGKPGSCDALWPPGESNGHRVITAVSDSEGAGEQSGTQGEGTAHSDFSMRVWQLAAREGAETSFIARSAAPIILQPWIRDAVRPSAWLLDSEGCILWRELSFNYRVPVTVKSMRSQFFRLQE